jgi:hypothetical protein
MIPVPAYQMIDQYEIWPDWGYLFDLSGEISFDSWFDDEQAPAAAWGVVPDDVQLWLSNSSSEGVDLEFFFVVRDAETEYPPDRMHVRIVVLFGDISDATMFKLMFGDCISEIKPELQ